MGRSDTENGSIYFDLNFSSSITQNLFLLNSLNLHILLQIVSTFSSLMFPNDIGTYVQGVKSKKSTD